MYIYIYMYRFYPGAVLPAVQSVDGGVTPAVDPGTVALPVTTQGEGVSICYVCKDQHRYK